MVLTKTGTLPRRAIVTCTENDAILGAGHYESTKSVP